MADELAAAEVEVCAWALGRVAVPVEAAQVVAVGVEQAAMVVAVGVEQAALVETGELRRRAGSKTIHHELGLIQSVL